MNGAVCKHVRALKALGLVVRRARPEAVRACAEPGRGCVVNDYPFGHYANEDDQPAPLCPYCGEYHYPSGHCPEDGPRTSRARNPTTPSRPTRSSWSPTG